MATDCLGRSGIVLLLFVAVILVGENLLIWSRSGVLPAIEFLLLDIVVLGVLAAAVYQARRRPLS